MKKVAIVTGGTRGIGRAIVEKLLEEGFLVALNYLSSTAKAKELEGKHPNRLLTFQGLDGFLEQVITTWGQIDVLVNNCGVSYTGLFQEMTTEDLTAILNNNLLEALLLTKDTIPFLLKSNRHPCIINISSIWGHKGASLETAYAVSKGGLNQMTTSLGRELGPMGIRTLGIAPGLIKTDMLDLAPSDLEFCLAKIPLKKIGSPLDVANLVFFLLEHGTYLNGTTITIDGGYSL